MIVKFVKYDKQLCKKGNDFSSCRSVGLHAMKSTGL